MTPHPEWPADLADLERRLGGLNVAEPAPALRARVLAAACAELAHPPGFLHRLRAPAAAMAAAAALLLLNLGLLDGHGPRGAAAGAGRAGAIPACAAQIRALLPELDAAEVRSHAVSLGAGGGLLPVRTVGAGGPSVRPIGVPLR